MDKIKADPMLAAYCVTAGVVLFIYWNHVRSTEAKQQQLNDKLIESFRDHLSSESQRIAHEAAVAQKAQEQ